VQFDLPLSGKHDVFHDAGIASKSATCPLVCAAEKPTRVEALKYYRKAAEHYALELRLYERVLRVDGQDGKLLRS